MSTRVHADRFDSDYRMYATADIMPAAIEPAPEWEWVSSATDPRGGFSRRTGRNLTDEQGHTLYDVPIHVSTLKGVEVRGARVRVRGLSRILPALHFLRPVGDVIVETSNRGTMTITCDDIEPIETASAAKHGADHE